MYEAFYGLTEKPFNLTPDPRFLYLSTKHKEAFAHLLFGIRNRCGFIMVSGEIGTGKTTICRSLLRQLDPDTEVAFIFNPKLSPLELLQTINSDFGIASKAGTVRGLIDELNAYLLARSSEGKNCVLIIDEAQNLGTETLEQVRLLSNLETETQKLLQIVLIGQPELAQKLELRELRQLNQRIVARYHLGALNREETLHYIAFRMRVAGARTQVRFTRSAVRLVYRISQGTPRVINALCDRALLIGYTKETRTITPRIVKTAAKEIQGDYHVRVTKVDIGRALPVSAAITTAAVLVLGFMAVSSWPFPRSFDGLNAKAFFGIATDAQDKASMSDAPPSVSAPAPAEREPAQSVIDDAASKETPARSTGANRNVVEAASLPDAPAERVAKTPGSTAVARVNAGVLPSDPGSASAPRATGPHLGAMDLVRAWNLAVLTPPPATLSVGGLYRFAEANGLRLTELASSLDQLAAINLPVMMVLRHEGKNRWGALVRLNGDAAEVAYEDGTHIFLGRSALRRAYRDKAYCLWSDPALDALPLRAMSAGPDVDRLQDDLETLGLLDRAPTGLYDAATVDAVTRIQRATGLEPDGIVGPQTRMVLTCWLNRHAAPSLNDQPFSEKTRAEVLANAGMIPSETAQEIDGQSALPREDAAKVEAPSPEAASAPVKDAEMSTTPITDDIGTTSGGAVEMEPLFEVGYAPLLESADSGSPQVTPALGPVAPIVPRDEKGAVSR